MCKGSRYDIGYFISTTIMVNYEPGVYVTVGVSG